MREDRLLLFDAAAAALFLASIEPPVHELLVLNVVWSSAGIKSLMRLFEAVNDVAVGCGNYDDVLFMFKSNFTFPGRRMALAS